MPPSIPPLTDAPDRTAILKARARALAHEATPRQAAETFLEVIEFGLSDERYAVAATAVSEVHPLEELTPVPCTPAFIRGLVNVRGRIFPVIDLKKFFDLPEQGITDLHRILLIEAPDLEFGLLADTIAGVRQVSLNAIQPSLPTLTGIRAEYLKGVTADRLVILDIAAILADRKIIVHEDVDISV